MSALNEDNKNKIFACLIHCTRTEDTLFPFTKKRFETFLRRRKEWLQLEDSISAIAKNSLEVCPENESSERCDQYHFHQKCYNTFTDVSKIERANQQKEGPKVEDNDGNGDDQQHESESPKPKRRTRVAGKHVLHNPSQNVLPDVCIICKKKDSYINKKVCFLTSFFFCILPRARVQGQGCVIIYSNLPGWSSSGTAY